MAYKFTARGRWVTKIITILLSAFSFTLFALTSTMFLFDRVDLARRAFWNACQYYERQGEFLSFATKKVEYSADYSMDYVRRAEEETGARFLHTIAENRVKSTYSDFGYEANLENQSEELKNYDRWPPSNYLYAKDEDYAQFGFELTVGRYPREKNEIAVSEAHFQFFQAFGYTDVTPLYELENDWYHIADKYKYRKMIDGATYVFVREECLPPREEIMQPQDLVGKNMLLFGDPDVKYSDIFTFASDHEKITPVKIVGVVDTHWDPELKNEYRGDIFVTQEWIDSSIHRSAQCVPIPDYKTAMKYFDLTLKLHEEIAATGAPRERIIAGFSGDGMLRELFRKWEAENDQGLLSILFCSAGLIFGIFSVLLCGNLVTWTMDNKRKQIGILRSMGASERRVKLIFLIGILYLALIIFVVALGMFLGAFYGFFEPLAYIDLYGVSMFVLNGWNVLILFAMCMGVPLLSALLPIKKFFRASIVENIKGIRVKKKRHA